MNTLDNMLCAWSESLMPGSQTYDQNLLSPPRDKTASPSLISFGSYRLNVHTPDADVDCLVLAPPHVTREDFFDSWVDVLKNDSRVTELHPVATAYTPVIKFEMDEVKIDLIFALVGNNRWLIKQRAKADHQPIVTSIMANGDGECDDEEERIEMRIDDDVLIGLDETSVRSVNGVRVAQCLLDMLDNGNAAQIDNFRVVLRTVKSWAKHLGLYSNVCGFLGGINWAILVCWVCIKNPNAPPSLLLHLFFQTFANWRWPSPVYLVKQNQPPKFCKPLPIWNPKENFRDSKHIMPIITPCYPEMNSSYNVGEPQLRRLREELARASQITRDILNGKTDWSSLFDCNFFQQHAIYLQVNISAIEEDDFRIWYGLCESRIRLLIGGLESSTVRAYPFAKFFERRDEEDDNRRYIASFYIGLRFARTIMRVDIGTLVTDYLFAINSFEARTQGMDVTMNVVSKKDLPGEVAMKDTFGVEQEEVSTALKSNSSDDESATEEKELQQPPVKRSRIS